LLPWFVVFTPQRWVWAFRSHIAVMAHTNNGIEAQNKCFKYDYLQPFKSKTLSNMLECLVHGFLLDSYRKYVLSHGYCHYAFQYCNVITLTVLHLEVCQRMQLCLDFMCTTALLTFLSSTFYTVYSAQ